MGRGSIHARLLWHAAIARGVGKISRVSYWVELIFVDCPEEDFACSGELAESTKLGNDSLACHAAAQVRGEAWWSVSVLFLANVKKKNNLEKRGLR